MELEELFGRFQLDLLPSDWVKTLWDDSFAEIQDLPIEYESYLEEIEIGDLLSSASQFLKDWLSPPDGSNRPRPSSVEQAMLNDSLPIRDDDENGQRQGSTDKHTWRTLLESKVQHKALLCLLSVFIRKGKADPMNTETRILCLKATSLYLMLLAVPGSNVFQIFNSILYSHTIESLKMCESLLSLNCSTETKPKAKKSGKKKQKNISTESNEEDSHIEGNDDKDREEGMEPHERSVLIKMVYSLLNDLIFFIERFKLKEEQDSLVLTIQILILITRLEKNSASIIVNTPSQNSIAVLAHKAYKALSLLCLKQHGDQQETVRLILREIAPYIENAFQVNLDLNAKEETILKDHTVQFIHYLHKYVKLPSQIPIKCLIQRLCVKTPDRADARAKSVQIILEIMDPFPPEFYSSIVFWIMRLSFTEETKNKLTGIDLISKLILLNKTALKSTVLPTTSQDRCSPSKGFNYASHKFLLAVIFAKCRDSSSTVMAKALAVLANLISSNSKGIREEVESIFVTPYINAICVEDCRTYHKAFYRMHAFFANNMNLSNTHIDPLPGAKVVLNLLARYTYHEKVFVRKSSIQALINIFLLNDGFITDNLLKDLFISCRDLSVAVRKLLIQSMTDLVIKYPAHSLIPTYWASGVLPLISDQEIKSQEKVLEAMQLLIIDNIVAYDKAVTPLHEVPWRILPLIPKLNLQSQFSFVCYKWTLSNIITQDTFRMIATHVGTQHNRFAWYLLSALSLYVDIDEPQFVLDYFYGNVHNEVMVDQFAFQTVTETLHLNHHKLSKPEQVQLKADLLAALNRFIVPLPIIDRYMDMCQMITERYAGSEVEARAQGIEFADKIIDNAERKLVSRIGPDCPIVLKDESNLAQVVFTIGSAAMISPDKVDDEIVPLLRNLVHPDAIVDKGKKMWKGTTGPVPKAVAVVTLGKLSLQDPDTAKDLVPLFAHLLSTTKFSSIKINCLLCLSDLCVRFTSMVESHIPEMAFCLRDKDVKVRERALQVLTGLIQQDYLKLRCPLLFHLLVMINDDEESISNAARAFITNCVVMKDDYILTMHFVECIFHYNNYDGHPTYSKNKMSAEEKAAFSLSGQNRREKRMNIYKFIITTMSDENRFRTVHRLCIDILEGVADGLISLKASGGVPVLLDAFNIISSDEIRLSPLGKASLEEPEEADNSEHQKLILSKFAKKTLLTVFLKANIIENVAPSYIKLKKYLTKIKSSLVNDLRLSLRTLIKDYKGEINQVLSEDPELAAEIALDVRNSSDPGSDDDSVPEAVITMGGPEIFKQAVILAALDNEHFQGTEAHAVLRRSTAGTIPDLPFPLTPRRNPSGTSSGTPGLSLLSMSSRKALQPRTSVGISVVSEGFESEDTAQSETSKSPVSTMSRSFLESLKHGEPQPGTSKSVFSNEFETNDVAQPGTSKSILSAMSRSSRKSLKHGEPQPGTLKSVVSDEFETNDMAQPGTSKSVLSAMSRSSRKSLKHGEPQPGTSKSFVSYQFETNDTAQPGTSKSAISAMSRSSRKSVQDRESDSETSKTTQDDQIESDTSTTQTSKRSKPKKKETSKKKRRK